MRVVRIDTLAPGGAALEVHPRLTLLRGASPELRRRLGATVRALVGDGPLGETGVIEVSGVQLALDEPTLAQLRLDRAVDPVLGLGVASVPPTTDNGAALPPPVVVVSGDEAALRAQLREVTTARTRLGERMDAAREGLDSFSTAALEVCLGQIEALEARRATLRVDVERDRGAHEREVAAASVQLAELRTLADRVRSVIALGLRLGPSCDAAASAEARATAPDPSAAQLASQLEVAAARVRELAERHDHRRTQLSLVTDELAQARRAVDEAERRPQIDRNVVQRLEEVRDEIFATDDRQSVLGSARNKRRLAELRSEEAILLDRLGFDTYSSYVMGIPSVRADLERAAQVTAARDHADQLEAQVALLRTQLADTDDQDDAAQQLHRLAREAARRLEDAAGPADLHELARSVATGGTWAAWVHRTTTALRGLTLVDPAVARSAVRALQEVLGSIGDAVGTGPLSAPAGPVEVPALPDAPVVDGGGPVVVARAWLDWMAAAERWVDDTEDAVVELEHRVAGAGAGPDGERIARWAEVEAELDQALDRLGEAQERVRVHEAATAELATLRTEELALRDRERDLLDRIARADAAIVPAAPPPPPPPELDRADPGAGAGAEADADAVEWAVVARLARQRSVSFVGSVPLLVEGLPGAPDVRDAVLRRLDRMSDLVQVIVLADDDAAAAWAGGLGDRGRRIDL